MAMTILDFSRKKQQGEKLTMLTCYDYTSARILSNTALDCILVGDSVAMTMHGFPHTLAATLSMMEMHTAAVARGAPGKFIVADLPFLSYRKALSKNVEAVQRIMQAGAHGVKLEGAVGNLKLIEHLVASGVPVMGHLGLTPQAVHVLGGYKVQAKTIDAQAQLRLEAEALQDAGCFALVLECVPSSIAAEISKSLLIPSIGIGAGGGTDGQVLVFQDLLGLNLDFKPKFVKNFVQGGALFKAGIDDFVNAVKTGAFPQDEHSY